MARIEDWHQPEQKTFAGADLTCLSQSTQNYFQPIDRATAGQQDLPWALDFGTGADLYRLPAYTGERLSASAIMADDVEQKLDAPKIQPSSDALTRPSVIRTKEDEAIWDKMQEPHKLGKHESATHIGLSSEVIADMQKKGQASKLELFDSKAEEAPDAVVAWDPREWASKTAKQAEHATERTVLDVQRKADFGKATIDNPDLQYRETPPKGGDYRYPHRGREDDFVSYPACTAASMPFENIRMRMGAGPGHIDPNLIAGMMRNEQFFYKQIGDVGTDNYVRVHGNLDILHDDSYSIGPAQMQIRNIHNLIAQFPDQLGQYANDPLRAALRPGDAPMFVAAYMSNVITNLENGTNPGFSNGVWNNIVKHWKAGDANGAMILAFNPDPNQIEHVNTQLKIIADLKKKAD
jgi:hypothetical protein